MGVNRLQPHLYVLPEDDANRQLALEFQLSLDASRIRRMQVLSTAGGWLRVLERFCADLIVTMESHPLGFALLLIDFDSDPARLNIAKGYIPDSLAQRVFILGVWTEPEELKARLGSYKAIGSAMALDCREGTGVTWEHKLLRHNSPELARLRESVRPILF
jgi:hypothetical protein